MPTFAQLKAELTSSVHGCTFRERQQGGQTVGDFRRTFEGVVLRAVFGDLDPAKDVPPAKIDSVCRILKIDRAAVVCAPSALLPSVATQPTVSPMPGSGEPN